MMVYINYPQPHFMIHRDAACGLIRQHNKPNQRVLPVRLENLAESLQIFINKQVDFASHAGLNDLWLDVTLDSEERERSFVSIVQALLGVRYKPLGQAAVERHC